MGNEDLSQTELSQRNYYNQIAEEYDEHYALPAVLKYAETILDQVFGGFDLTGVKVLDAMCGGGQLTRYFAARGAEITGLDISDDCCHIFARRFPNCKIVCSSMLKTEFPDACFDIVITDSLHHLQPDLDKGLAEILRVLKPGGRFCCWEPSAGSLLDLVRKLWYKLDRRYFQSNEKSVDVAELLKLSQDMLGLERTIWGGNVAYIFVNLSMALRIPIWLVRCYAPIMLRLEKFFQFFQTRFTSCWVVCLMTKKNA